MNHNIVDVTKEGYSLENGDFFESEFSLPDGIKTEEMQVMLDNATNAVEKLKELILM